MKKFLINILLLSGVIYLLSGCSDVNKSKADSFTELRILPSNKTVPEEAETVDFKAYGVYFDQSFEDQTEGVLWSSSDISVAEIEQNGTVTFQGLGDTTITAVYNLEGDVHEQSTLLSVREGMLQEITIDPEDPIVPKGFSQRFKAIGHFSDGSTHNISKLVTWDSSEESVAVIQPPGLLFAIAETNVTDSPDGNMTNISVLSIHGKSATTVLTTSPAELQSITISPDGAQMERNETIELRAEGLFSDNSKRDVTHDLNWTTGVPSSQIITLEEEEDYIAATSSVLLFGDVNVTARKSLITLVKDTILIKVVR